MIGDTRRVASLDLLRGIAAYSVAIPHFFLYNGGGHLFERVSVSAVEIFFVLSGYVLAPQLLFVLSGAKKGLQIFLMRRWMRTIPAYFLALLLVTVFFKQIGSADFYRYMFYVQNLFRQHNAVDYYSVAWSLSVEEWFYVVFPIFMIICAKLTRKHEISDYLIFTCFFIVTITAARFIFTPDPYLWGQSTRRVVMFRMDSIAYGFLLFLVTYLFGKRPSTALRWIGLLGSIGGIIGLLEIIEQPIAQALFPFAAASLGCFSILVCLSVEDNLETPVMRHICTVAGQTSYAVYLFHTLVIYVIGYALDGYSIAIRFMAFLIGTSAMAVFSTYLIEQPILQLRPKYRGTDDGFLPLRFVEAKAESQ